MLLKIRGIRTPYFGEQNAAPFAAYLLAHLGTRSLKNTGGFQHLCLGPKFVSRRALPHHVEL